MSDSLQYKLDCLDKVNSKEYTYEMLNNDSSLGECIDVEIIGELDKKYNTHDQILIDKLKLYLDKYMLEIGKEFDNKGEVGFGMFNCISCNNELNLYFLNNFGMKLNDIIGIYTCYADGVEDLVGIVSDLIVNNIMINKNSIEKHREEIEEYIEEGFFDIPKGNVIDYLKKYE